MKYTTVIGILLFAIGVSIFYFTNLELDRLTLDKEFLVGVFCGLGFGMIFGGILGWMYKRRKIQRQIAKESQQARDINQEVDDSGLL
ncbi:hypothetical protein ACF3NR_08095 [Vaginella massiliensis]|uniref:hypothetical protein n=1 Tax=Vaginella massiliensis TaxID=1816680 RepID=UPI0008393DFA|nr:hypothetical protein [Vaginella massiliensis]